MVRSRFLALARLWKRARARCRPPSLSRVAQPLRGCHPPLYRRAVEKSRWQTVLCRNGARRHCSAGRACVASPARCPGPSPKEPLATMPLAQPAPAFRRVARRDPIGPSPSLRRKSERLMPARARRAGSKGMATDDAKPERSKRARPLRGWRARRVSPTKRPRACSQRRSGRAGLKRPSPQGWRSCPTMFVQGKVP